MEWPVKYIKDASYQITFSQVCVESFKQKLYPLKGNVKTRKNLSLCRNLSIIRSHPVVVAKLASQSGDHHYEVPSPGRHTLYIMSSNACWYGATSFSKTNGGVHRYQHHQQKL